MFRILSLDGGGIKGTFTASVLVELEKMEHVRINEYFDLITGTSTGGIIAIALGLGIPMDRVLQLYKEEGKEIFPNGHWVSKWNWIKHLFTTKYSPERLRHSLENIFEDRLLGESQNRLVIPSYDAVAGDIHLFKTAHHQNFKQDLRRKVIDIALATTAAPTFFPSHNTDEGLNHLDGGVWANCPVMVGITESISYLNQKLDDVYMLSIGTTEELFTIPMKHRKKSGALPWITSKKLIDLFMQAGMRGAQAQAQSLLGERFVRLNQSCLPGQFSLDGSLDCPDLNALGISVARHNEKRISSMFFHEKCQRFVPEHFVMV